MKFRSPPLSAMLIAYGLSSSTTFADTQTLAVTTVKAIHEEKKASSAPYGETIITDKQLATTGARNIGAAIAEILGIPTRADLSGGRNYGFDLRGFGGASGLNQVVVVDGQVINNDDLSGVNLNVVSIEDIEKILILHGIGAVQYGAGATGGVIEITTKSGIGKKRVNQATLGASYGSFNTLNEHTSATLASGGFSVDVAGKNEKTDGFRKNFASTRNNLAATLQWSNDWLRVWGRTGRYMEQSGLPGALSTQQYEQDRTYALNLNDRATLKNETGGLFGEAVLGDWTVSGNVNQRQAYADAFYTGFTYSSQIKAKDLHIQAKNDLSTDQYINRLMIGADGSKWQNMVLGSFGSITKSTSAAVFATNDFTWKATNTLFNVGLRLDHVKKERTGTSIAYNEKPVAWQLGVSQPITKELEAYGHVASSYRLANADEFTFTLPNTMLKTQTSQDMEAGLRYKHVGTKINAHWFRSNLTDEIGYDPTVVNPGSWTGKGANVNFDPTRHDGIDLTATQTVNDQLSVSARYGWRQAIFLSGAHAGSDIPLVPKNMVTLSGTWTPIINHILTASLNWVDAQRVTFDNTCSIPAYTTVNARYAITQKNVEWALSVNNLFDAKYYTVAQACTGGVPSSIYPEMGRNITGSVIVKF